MTFLIFIIFFLRCCWRHLSISSTWISLSSFFSAGCAGKFESLRCAVFLYTLNNLLFLKGGQGTEHTKKTRTCKNPWSFKHIWVWVWKMNWYITPFQKAGKKKKRNKEWSLSVKTLPKAKNGCWAQFAFFLSLQHFCKDSEITWTKPGGWFRLQFLFPNLFKTKTLEEGFPLWGLKFFWYVNSLPKES